MNTTKIVETISLETFREIVKKRKNSIILSHHALNHLSDAQRKVYRKEDLIYPLLKEKPVAVGIQKNGRYAVFFKRKNSFLRIIIDVKDSKIEIITFINMDNVPNMWRIENEK